jgi:cAMP-dependent protein kinase regulator
VKLPVARPDPRTQAVTRPYTAKAPLAPPVPAQPPRRIELTTVPLHPPVKVPPLQDEEVGNTTIPGDTGLVAFLGEGSEVSEHTVVAKLPFLDALATVPPAPAPSTSTSSAELGEGELLNRVPLFAELSPAAFTSLLEAASMIRLSKGEVAVEQGTGGDSIYAILTGRVRVFRNEPSGKRRELAILEPGAVFGELAWVTGSSRSAWVVAEVDDTTVLEMTRQLLVKLGPGNPSIARGLATIARRRILSNMMAIEPLFAGLKRNERVDLLEQFEAVDLGRGEVALGEGSELDGLFVVTAGEIEVSSDDGVEMIGPGVLLGDHLALSGEQLFSAVATKRSQVLHLSEASTQRLLAHSSVSGKKDALKRAAWERHRGLR